MLSSPGPASLLAAAGIFLPLQFASQFALGAIAAPKPPGCYAPAEHRAEAWSQPTAPDQLASPDEADEIAALEAIRIALTEVGDGNAYVWHQRNGHLSGLVQPTTSFKDPTGRVCRHILLLIVRGDRMGRVEGTACRLGGGRWNLER
jgi:hypothetical protein